MNTPVQITDARMPLRRMEVACLGVSAVVATPGLRPEDQVRLIRRILEAAGVP
jgi:hypothetical protein